MKHSAPNMTILAAISLAMSAITSCSGDSYVEPSSKISLRLQWDRDICPRLPKWVTVVGYSEGRDSRERYISPEGDDFSFGSPDYKSMLIFSGDTECILFSGMESPGQAAIQASPLSYAPSEFMMERHPGSRTVNPPDMICSAFVEDTEAAYADSLSLTMRPLVYTYRLRFEFDEGAQYIDHARVAFGGTADRVNLADGTPSEATAVILSDCRITDSGCIADITSFGAPGRSETAATLPYTLTLELGLTDRTLLSYDFDVSGQVQSIPKGGVLTVSGLRIEADIDPEDSDMDVSVSDWIGDQSGGQDLDMHRSST